MMLKERLNQDMIAAMKARDKARLSVIRMVLAEVKHAQAAVSMKQELDEAEVLKVVAAYQKRLEKSLGDYPPGEQRTALEAEIRVVDAYLPRRASADDVRAAVRAAIASGVAKDMGLLIKTVMSTVSGADGKTVSQVVKEELA